MTAPLSERVRGCAARLSVAGDAVKRGEAPALDVAELERELQSALEDLLQAHAGEIVKALAKRAANVSADLSLMERGLAATNAATLADQLAGLANSCEALRQLVKPSRREAA